MPSWLSRLVVVAVGVPVVVGLLYLGGWWLFALAAIAALVGLHELYGMARPLRPLVLAGYGGAIGALVGARLGGIDWLLGGFLATLLLAFLLFLVASTRAQATVSISSTLLGSAWIGVGLGCVLLLRDLPEHGRLAVLTILLADWADNAVAYLVGRTLGRHKFSPALSPAKTWEGFIAGSLAAVAVSFFALYDDRETFLSIWQALVLGGIVAAAVALGDLFESALKRDMQVKDTGRLLAAHGGMLDRIDSLLFAAPAGLYAILAFGHG